MRVEFDVFGDTQINRDILRVGSRGENPRPAFYTMSKYFYLMEREQFATEGGFASGSWPDLQDATKASKRSSSNATVRANADNILRGTDTLMKSLTRPNARFSIRRIRKDELFLGTRDPKTKHHQHGAPGANVPQRRPVEFRRKDKIAWIKMLQQWVIRGELPRVPAL